MENLTDIEKRIFKKIKKRAKEIIEHGEMTVLFSIREGNVVKAEVMNEKISL